MSSFKRLTDTNIYVAINNYFDGYVYKFDTSAAITSSVSSPTSIVGQLFKTYEIPENAANIPTYSYRYMSQIGQTTRLLLGV